MIGLGLRLPQIAVRQRVSGLVLDALSAAAAYSTRRLRTDYTGSLVRVQRVNATGTTATNLVAIW